MRGFFRMGRAGLSLVEVLTALAIISIAVLGLGASFKYIQRSMEYSKNQTMASNLAQEKLQILKQQTYFRVIPTPSPLSLSDGTLYDGTYFPPETILEGGVYFTRYTYIQVVSMSNGAITALPPTTPDTGLRQITVTVEWKENGVAKSIYVKSLLSNPNTVESNCILTGTVKDSSSSVLLSSAVVSIVGHAEWGSNTGGSGIYSINLSPGTFNLQAQAVGYFPQTLTVTAANDMSSTYNFSLVKMSSGSVTGTAAWMNPNVVISQVVLSTAQAGMPDAEYVELFNPTTGPVNIKANMNLNYASYGYASYCSSVTLVYVSTFVPSYSYYIISSTGVLTINGSTMAADAYYYPNITQCAAPASSNKMMVDATPGAVWLTDSSSNVVDAVGWSDTSYIPTHSPPYCLGKCYPVNGGFSAGWELVRTSSPAFVSSAYGRAYNSGSNVVDFTTSTTLAYQPYATSSSTQPAVIAGVPAVGAVITGSDGLSTTGVATLGGSPPVASFYITNVATGTWTVLISSNGYELENDTVTINSTGSLYVFPSSTTLLNSSAPSNMGMIAGYAFDSYGHAISTITISFNGSGSNVDASTSTGRYIMSHISTGTVTVTANPSTAVKFDSYYITVSTNVTVLPDQTTDGINFYLSQGGRISGFITRDGTNGLAGVIVTATDSSGNVQDEELTGTSGYFTTAVISTGTYTIAIPQDTTESSSPTSYTATISAGQNVFSATFTITGAMATITGTVTQSSAAIATGVLIVASTATISSTSGPPAISSATLLSGSIYATSSKEDGTYSLDVRQSTNPTYNIYAYYPLVSRSGVVSISTKTITGVSIYEGQTVSGENFSW